MEAHSPGSNTGLCYAACAACVTILVLAANSIPVLNFMELYAFTLVNCFYALLLRAMIVV